MSKNATDNGFLARLDALLDERGWNRAKLAKLTGISESTVSRWRSNAPKSDNLQAVADALGISMDDLTGRTSPRAESVFTTVASELGLDPGALNERAVAALRTFLRETSPARVTQAKHTRYAGPHTGGRMPDVLGSEVWNGLTVEQQAGLALLLGGRRVEQWRIVAALELLFAAAGPADGGERVTGVLRTR
jgi:transcriptional regulator with XRE-family HTH domain